MNESENIEMRFNDEVIGQIAKLVQLAILTGTDIVDNLRMIRVHLDSESDTLVLSESYSDHVDYQLEKLMEEIETFQTEQD